MEYFGEYRSLEHTCKMIRKQVIDSMPYIGEYIPEYINSPEQLFTYLKNVVTYVDDDELHTERYGYHAPDVEFIQTAQTFFKNGAKGDCDDFTVVVLAACEWLNFPSNFVCLTGNFEDAPTHIYSGTWWVNWLGNKKPIYLDLTNPVYNMQRDYKYLQTLPFKI